MSLKQEYYIAISNICLKNMSKMQLIKRLPVVLTIAFSIFILNCNGVMATGISEPRHEDVLRAPEIATYSMDYQGTLLLADSPEIVPRSGVTYRDVASGFIRIFIHQVNGTAFTQRIAVIIENKNNGNNEIEILKFGTSDANVNPLITGKQSQKRYFEYNKGKEIIQMKPNEIIELDCGLKSVLLNYNELLTSVIDLEAKSKVEVKVMLVKPYVDPTQYAIFAPWLPSDGKHPRGTFPGTERIMTAKQMFIASKERVSAISIGDGVLDQFQKGYDAIDNKPAVNHGNYGLNYNIFIPSPDNGEKFTVFLNARGSSFAGCGTTLYESNSVVIPLPKDQLSIGESPWSGYFADMGTFASGMPVWLTISPPGGSNLPVRLIFKYNGRFG